MKVTIQEVSPGLGGGKRWEPERLTYDSSRDRCPSILCRNRCCSGGLDLRAVVQEAHKSLVDDGQLPDMPIVRPCGGHENMGNGHTRSCTHAYWVTLELDP